MKRREELQKLPENKRLTPEVRTQTESEKTEKDIAYKWKQRES